MASILGLWPGAGTSVDAAWPGDVRNTVASAAAIIAAVRRVRLCIGSPPWNAAEDRDDAWRQQGGCRELAPRAEHAIANLPAALEPSPVGRDRRPRRRRARRQAPDEWCDRMPGARRPRSAPRGAPARRFAIAGLGLPLRLFEARPDRLRASAATACRMVDPRPTQPSVLSSGVSLGDRAPAPRTKLGGGSARINLDAIPEGSQSGPAPGTRLRLGVGGFETDGEESTMRRWHAIGAAVSVLIGGLATSALAQSPAGMKLYAFSSGALTIGKGRPAELRPHGSADQNSGRVLRDPAPGGQRALRHRQQRQDHHRPVLLGAALRCPEAGQHARRRDRHAAAEDRPEAPTTSNTSWSATCTSTTAATSPSSPTRPSSCRRTRSSTRCGRTSPFTGAVHAGRRRGAARAGGSNKPNAVRHAQLDGDMDLFGDGSVS